MKIALFGDSLTEGNQGVSFFTLLKNSLPHHQLINYGKSGDTVTSFYQRISKLSLDKDIDLAFLWVGVNDIIVKVSRVYSIILSLSNQPWVKSVNEFREVYNLILNLLKTKIKRVITVSPLFIGENLSNIWNQELEIISQIIENLSQNYENISYLSLTKYFHSKLRNKPVSDYVGSGWSVIVDSILLKTDDQINQKSKDRGLHYTVDGIHLNTIGAKIITNEFKRIITEQSQ